MRSMPASSAWMPIVMRVAPSTELAPMKEHSNPRQATDRPFHRLLLESETTIVSAKIAIQK